MLNSQGRKVQREESSAQRKEQRSLETKDEKKTLKEVESSENESKEGGTEE